MTGPSSSSSPSQLPTLAAAVSPKNGEEAAGVVRTSPPSISLLRPPIPTSEVRRGVGYPACGQAPYVALVIPAYEEICDMMLRLSRVLTGPIRGVSCTGVWGDIVIVWYGRTWRRLSGMLTGPIRGVGCTGVWGDIVIGWLSGVLTGPIRGFGYTVVCGDIVIVWYGRTWRRLSGVLTSPIQRNEIRFWEIRGGYFLELRSRADSCASKS
ncbi:hypothetical protein L3X38_027166 [Prunus dulcis]|uniref:Uncharacterized protein n=1 Tax=Prunus dulcis TaxID=3755 RepID=A0AAD4VME3_PRUDU|nr:hypothetical protein L3X38_027166 [Prunus dulcis]